MPKSEFPTEDEQRETIDEAEADHASALSVSREEIDHVLRMGSGLKDSKLRIFKHYQKNLSDQENVAFLKNEYGTGGLSITYPDGKQGDSWHDQRGIGIGRDQYSIIKPDLRLTWTEAAQRLRQLIRDGRYLSGEEKAKLSQRRTAQGFAYKPGDQVFLADRRRYQIDEVGPVSVTLHDPDFPMLRKVTTVGDFEAQLAADERNHALPPKQTEPPISAVEPPEEAPPFPITSEEWERIQPGYRTEKDGQKSILYQNKLRPVVIVEEKGHALQQFAFTLDGAARHVFAYTEQEARQVLSANGIDPNRVGCLTAGAVTGRGYLPAAEPWMWESGTALKVAEEYNRYKERYPNAMIALQVGKFTYIFDREAQIAARVLGKRLLSVPLIGNMETRITGFESAAWVSNLKKLWSCGGYDILLVGYDENGERAITKEHAPPL